MAIICDFYGIYLRKELIGNIFPGGIEGFRQMLCPALEDEHLVCFTYMNHFDVNDLLEELSKYGFRCFPAQHDSDVAVVAQAQEEPVQYAWLEYGKIDASGSYGYWLKGTEPGKIICPEYMLESQSDTCETDSDCSDKKTDLD